MQTTLFGVKTKDGRTFLVFCANRNQKERFIRMTNGKGYTISEIADGVHNIRQFEQIISTIN